MSNRLNMAFDVLQLVQKKWTLDDVAVFEKMLILAGRQRKKTEIQVNKKALQEELRLGRRSLDKSIARLTRARLIIPEDRFTYRIGSIPVILSEYYTETSDSLRNKLEYYLNKPGGKFNIANASK